LPTAPPLINIIGAGQLGQTLARLWQDKDLLQTQQVLTRSLESAEDACRFIGSGAPCKHISAFKPAQYWLIAAPDKDLAKLAEELARAALINSDDTVFHCSGALSSEILAPLQHQGALTASVHPIHSFASPTSSIQSFHGSHCACEGDAQALVSLDKLFEDIGGQCFKLESRQKSLYHAGSVMACNYLVSLLEASRETFALAGIDRQTSNALMAPLVQQTAENLLGKKEGGKRSEGATAASVLTGPIARGDHSVVVEQLQLLSDAQPELAELYRCLGQKTLKIARLKAAAELEQLDALEAILSAEPQPPS